MQQQCVEEERVASKPSINWRLVYNPECIVFGVSMMLQVSSLLTAYQCIPLLGEQTGAGYGYLLRAIPDLMLLIKINTLQFDALLFRIVYD